MSKSVLQMANSLIPLKPLAKPTAKRIPVGQTDKSNGNDKSLSLPVIPGLEGCLLAQEKTKEIPAQQISTRKVKFSEPECREEGKVRPTNFNKPARSETQRNENMERRESKVNDKELDPTKTTKLHQQISCAAQIDLSSRNRKLERKRMNLAEYGELLSERDREIRERSEGLKVMTQTRTEIMNQVVIAYYTIEELKAQLSGKNEYIKESKKHENSMKFEMKKLQQETERLKERCENTLREMEARIRAKDAAITKLQADKERYLMLRDEKTKENESLKERLEQKEQQVIDLKTKISLIGNWSVRT